MSGCPSPQWVCCVGEASSEVANTARGRISVLEEGQDNGLGVPALVPVALDLQGSVGERNVGQGQKTVRLPILLKAKSGPQPMTLTSSPVIFLD